jgi:hypothetical protein
MLDPPANHASFRNARPKKLYGRKAQQTGGLFESAAQILGDFHTHFGMRFS